MYRRMFQEDEEVDDEEEETQEEAIARMTTELIEKRDKGSEQVTEVMVSDTK